MNIAKTKVKNLIIISFLILFASYGFGQDESFVISDTNNVIYDTSPSAEELDSVVLRKDYPKHYSNWKVYYDKNKTQLAFESHLDGDTCNTVDYWRNGGVKRKSTYVNHDNFFIWWCTEHYYRNGQLIVIWCPSQFSERTLITRYFSNGKKQMEWTQFQIGVDGDFIRWHENGIMESRATYILNKEHGKWSYWNKEGILVKEEIWEDGELINTTNF
jgi:antitoxin component YwqK of YwqJK toxin-antitoxin module